MESKAIEFVRLVRSKHRLPTAQDFYELLCKLPDTEWDRIMDVILTNRKRDLNVGAFHVPVYTKAQKTALTDFIWVNNTCGLHNSYWSRMWWMAKGGKFIKVFPVNSIMLAFERGERTANDPVYKR